MEDLAYDLFGTGRDLSALQMTMRAFVVFILSVFLIRLSGMRSFGSKSAFDNIVVILLGAILSRAVTGVSPFFATIAAAAAICVTHRILAMLAARYHGVSVLLKGESRILYKDGKLDKENMLKAGLSQGDLEEGVRLASNVTSLDETKEVRMERSGQISVIKKF